MAAAREPRTTAAVPEDIGTFISNVSIGYVPMTPEESTRIQQIMRNTAPGTVNRQFLSNLLMLKIMAPEESAGLLVYPAPMVIDFVEQLKTVLTLRYRVR